MIKGHQHRKLMFHIMLYIKWQQQYIRLSNISNLYHLKYDQDLFSANEIYHPHGNQNI